MTSLYTRFAEVGRVCLIQYGPQEGKLCTIVDILDANRALIDGPENITGVRREVIALKWLALTDIKVGAARNARAKSLTAAWEKEGALAKWTGSAWAKKIAAKAAKANSTDFQRFQAKVKKQTLRKAVAKKLKVRA